MSKSQLNLVLAAAVLFAGASLSLGQSAKEQEAKLIAVIKSADASRKEKADACRELGVVGTRDAVPALAALLPDEEMNHMARYALEPIPDPSVDEAFRAALGTLKGRPLVGVIGSIGVRRDAKAVEPLAALLQDRDADVAQGAARALGSIGNEAAARELIDGFERAPAANELAFCEGLARAVEAMVADGRRDLAIEICDHYTDANLPHQVRAAGLRGAILARGNAGIGVLRENLHSDDYVLFAAACRTTYELPGSAVTQALVDALKPSSSDRQIVLLQALGKRADVSALPAVSAAAKSGPTPVRLAAIDSMASIGSTAAIPALTDLMGVEDREVAQAAQESFASLQGKEVDEAIIAMLNSGDVNRKIVALDLVSRRRMISSMPVVLKATSDSDPRVRAAATRKLGELGTASDVPTLLEMLMTAKTGADLEAAEQALSAVLGRAENAEASIGNLAGRVPQASAEQKGALLRVLGTVGGGSALQAVRAAVDDPDAEVRTTAVRTLGAWKSAEAAPDLLALAKSSPNNTTKVLALRGYLRLAAQQDIPARDRLGMCRQATSVVQRPEEKRLLLTALGSLRSRESVAMAVPFLTDDAVKEEAGAAIVSIAENLLRGRNVPPAAAAGLEEPLNQVAAATGNADLAKRAKALARQAKTKADAK